MSEELTSKKKYIKNYYLQNKEEYKNRYNKLLECELCGAVYKKSLKAYHNKTKYHKLMVDVNNSIKKVLSQLV